MVHLWLPIFYSVTNQASTSHIFNAPLISDEIVDDVEIDLEAVNSMSFKKRRMGKRSKNWTDDETDRFYEAVTIVGNDVIAIATAFRNRGKLTFLF